MIFQKQYKLYSAILLILVSFATPVFVSETQAQSEVIIYYKKAFKSKTLSGYVRTPSGSIVSDVKVEIMDKKWSKTLEETTTDEDGFFSLSETKKGLYFLQLSKEGFNTIQ